MQAFRNGRWRQLLLAIMLIGMGLTETYAAQVVFLKGDVKMQDPKAKLSDIKDKQTIPEEHGIITGPDSMVVLKLNDGSTVKIEENSTIQIETLIQKGKKNESVGVSQFVLKLGSMMVNVLKKYSGKPTLQVRTDKGINFGVRGTMFVIFKETDSDDVWTVVKNGVVWAVDELHDDVEVIEAGNSMLLHNGIELTSAYPYRWVEKIEWDAPVVNSVTTGPIVELRQAERKAVYDKVKMRKRRGQNQTEGQNTTSVNQSTSVTSNVTTGAVVPESTTIPTTNTASIDDQVVASGSGSGTGAGAGAAGTTSNSGPVSVGGATDSVSIGVEAPAGNPTEDARSLAERFCQRTDEQEGITQCQVLSAPCFGNSFQTCRVQVAGKDETFYCCADINAPGF